MRPTPERRRTRSTNGSARPSRCDHKSATRDRFFPRIRYHGRPVDIAKEGPMKSKLENQRSAREDAPHDLMRREFVACSAAAGLAAVTGATAAATTAAESSAGRPVVEQDVQIPVTDGL